MAANGLIRAAILKDQLPEKLVTLVLLFVLLTAAVAGVTSVLTGPDWGSLWRGLIFGLLVGWMLAMFKQPLLSSALIAGPLGVIYALLYSGGLSQKLSALLIEFTYPVGRITVSPYHAEVDLTPINRLLAESFTTTAVVFGRVQSWVLDLLVGEPAFDPVAAAFVWIVLVWMVAAWAGWTALAGKSALVAVLPALLLSVGTLSYGRRETFAIYIMLGSTLLLLAAVQHDRREHQWDETDTAYPQRKGRQIGSAAVLISAGLVLLSASVTYISVPRILDWASAFRESGAQQEGGLAESLGIVSAVTATPDLFESVRRPGLPQSMLIGSGPELSKRIVMTVAVKDYYSLFEGGQPQPLYWRSFTYDVYTGHGWQTSGTTSNQYPPAQPLQLEKTARNFLIDQVVRPVRSDTGIVYAAGEPLAVDRASDAAWRSSGDLFGIRMTAAGSYEARSFIPDAHESTLRAERQNYPEWIRQRYLSLPPELPGRVAELALQLTAFAPTPYDRVRAIEGYLRTIPYTLDVPYPPVDQDLVDFFLFDIRKGYCDYYASAMVILARAAGVPARFATGFASGTYDLNARRFLVSEADAHSWVEVYFPDTGWVAFEPTAGRSQLETIQEPFAEPESGQSTAIEPGSIDRVDDLASGRLILLGLMTAIGVFGAAWVGFQEFRLRRLSEAEAAVEIYRRLRRFGIQRLAVTSEPGDTPYEYAASLRSGLHKLAQYQVAPTFEQRVLDDITALMDRIVETCYRPSLQREPDRYRLIYRWKGLRWRLGMMWLIKVCRWFRERFWGYPPNTSRNSPAGVELER